VLGVADDALDRLTPQDRDGAGPGESVESRQLGAEPEGVGSLDGEGEQPGGSGNEVGSPDGDGEQPGGSG
jgi:hypothetical protein